MHTTQRIDFLYFLLAFDSVMVLVPRSYLYCIARPYYPCPYIYDHAHAKPTSKPDPFTRTSSRLILPVLAELPLVEGVSESADTGRPYVLNKGGDDVAKEDGEGGKRWRPEMGKVIESP